MERRRCSAGLKGEEILLPARIARAAAEAALFDSLGGAQLVSQALQRRSGRMLDPDVAAELIAHVGELLDEANAGDPRELILDLEPNPVFRDVSELPALATAFGDLTDLKTTFTHGHSREVARLAKAAGERLALDAELVARLEVAASLHDLGRVGISNAIWEKPGSLTSVEWEQVRLHAYYSERILSGSGELAPMAAIAGMHHERLDGSGYHRGSRAGELSVGAKVSWPNITPSGRGDHSSVRRLWWRVFMQIMQTFDGFTVSVDRIVGCGDTVLAQLRYRASPGRPGKHSTLRQLTASISAMARLSGISSTAIPSSSPM